MKKKVTKMPKLQLDRETLHRLNPISEEVTVQVAGGRCTAAVTSCVTCTTCSA